MKYETEQEGFWAGEFGNEYVSRNNVGANISNKMVVFTKALTRTTNLRTVLELGANIGQNIVALQMIKPELTFGAVEINQKAIQTLNTRKNTTVFPGSIFDFSPEDLGKYDLTFTSGVLIHIDPTKLTEMYRKLYHCSSRYIFIKEYYNPTPVEVPYRDNRDKLFKRDFAGEMLDQYPDLKLIDYGFQYHRDNNFPSDDSTWFLLEK